LPCVYFPAVYFYHFPVFLPFYLFRFGPCLGDEGKRKHRARWQELGASSETSWAGYTSSHLTSFPPVLLSRELATGPNVSLSSQALVPISSEMRCVCGSTNGGTRKNTLKNLAWEELYNCSFDMTSLLTQQKDLLQTYPYIFHWCTIRRQPFMIVYCTWSLLHP
jgi:hypothetical protein